ncbi:MAG: SH3 domain-containing protein [Porcipelethomonas sp.]
MVKAVRKVSAVIVSVILILTMSLGVSAAGEYKNWIQSDPRWGSKILGSSGDTMAQIGCAVTSVAILCVHSGSASESSFNPGVLCDYLSKNGGFGSYGDLYWGAVSGLVPDFTFQKKADITTRTKAAITSQLAGYINQGYYIVLSVKYDGHWIAIDTIQDGEVYMIDPAQNKTKKLFDVYDTDGMLQVRLYKGKNAPAKVDTSASSVTYLTGHYKTTDALNLRSSYSTSSGILTTIPKGETVVVTRVYNNEWGEVEYDGKSGWIFLEYTTYTEGSYTYKLGNYKVNVQSGVYLRRSIGTQSTAECLMPYNAAVTIDLVTANWGRASYGSSTGWVCMEYLTYSGDTAVTTNATTTAAVTTKTTAKSTVAATTSAAVTTSSKPLVRGDINRDGKFTTDDLIKLNDYIAKPVQIGVDERYTLDVNGDNVIDERDSVYLLKIINKGIS